MFAHPLSFFPPSLPSQWQFGPNHRKLPNHEPLPYVEGCGLNQWPSNSLRSKDSTAAASPFSTGMWASLFLLNRGIGGGETWGEPGIWRHMQRIPKMNYDGSFCWPSFYPTPTEISNWWRWPVKMRKWEMTRSRGQQMMRRGRNSSTRRDPGSGRLIRCISKHKPQQTLWLTSSAYNPPPCRNSKPPNKGKTMPMPTANKLPHFVVCSPFWGCALHHVIGPVFHCMPVLHSWCLSVVLIRGLADHWHLLCQHHAALIVLHIRVIYVLLSIVIMVESVIVGYSTPSSCSLHCGGILYCHIWLLSPCWGFPPQSFGLRVVVIEHTTEG